VARVGCRICAHVDDEGECELPRAILPEEYLYDEDTLQVAGCGLGDVYAEVFTDGSTVFRNVLQVGPHRFEVLTTMGVDPEDPQGWVAVVPRNNVGHLVLHLDPEMEAMRVAVEKKGISIWDIMKSLKDQLDEVMRFTQ